MTPGLEAAMTAISETAAWGYGAGLGFVVLVIVLRRGRGGE